MLNFACPDGTGRCGLPRNKGHGMKHWTHCIGFGVAGRRLVNWFLGYHQEVQLSFCYFREALGTATEENTGFWIATKRKPA